MPLFPGCVGLQPLWAGGVLLGVHSRACPSSKDFGNIQEGQNVVKIAYPESYNTHFQYSGESHFTRFIPCSAPRVTTDHWMNCLSSLCHHAPFKLGIKCSISSPARNTGFALMALCSKIAINISTLFLPPSCAVPGVSGWMAGAGHPWEMGCETTWVGSSMAGPKFSNALQQSYLFSVKY